MWGPCRAWGLRGCGQRWPATQRRVHLPTHLFMALPGPSTFSLFALTFTCCLFTFFSPSPSPCSNANLLSVEVCLDPSKKDEPTAINCPGARADAVGEQAGVVECTGNIWMRLGIEVGWVGWGGGGGLVARWSIGGSRPGASSGWQVARLALPDASPSSHLANLFQVPKATCKSRSPPCASVPALPSACRSVAILARDLPVTDFEVSCCEWSVPHACHDVPASRPVILACMLFPQVLRHAAVVCAHSAPRLPCCPVRRPNTALTGPSFHGEHAQHAQLQPVARALQLCCSPSPPTPATQSKPDRQLPDAPLLAMLPVSSPAPWQAQPLGP